MVRTSTYLYVTANILCISCKMEKKYMYVFFFFFSLVLTMLSDYILSSEIPICLSVLALCYIKQRCEAQMHVET